MMHAILLAMGDNIRACDSAQFDGTNDWMTRGAGLTGSADAKSGIISFWFRLDAGGSSQAIFCNASTLGGVTPRFAVNLNGGTSAIDVTGFNPSSSVILSLSTASTYGASATWRHFLASWDLASGVAHLYVNDASDLAGSPTLTNDVVDYTVADWLVGTYAPSSSFRFNGCLAEMYFAPGQYLDFSSIVNRRKFGTSRRPVYLGADGSLPTGIAPLVYFHIDPGETAADFATNRGTGGDFTVTGALTTGSTGPTND